MMNLQQLDDLHCAEISNIKAAQKVLSLDWFLSRFVSDNEGDQISCEKYPTHTIQI
jgi:hypothetical protein